MSRGINNPFPLRPPECEGERNHNYTEAFHPMTQVTTYWWGEIPHQRWTFPIFLNIWTAANVSQSVLNTWTDLVSTETANISLQAERAGRLGLIHVHSKHLPSSPQKKAFFYFLAASPMDINPVSRNMATICGAFYYRSSATERVLKEFKTDNRPSRKLQTGLQNFFWAYSLFCENMMSFTRSIIAQLN